MLALFAFAALAADPILEKTFVAWVRVADLDARGGSVLTLDDGRQGFDGVVFGEIAPKRWMPGSEMFRRTEQKQDGWPEESAKPTEDVQVAIVYRKAEIAVYRNGKRTASYRPAAPLKGFDDGALVAFGMRHLDGGPARFAGSVDDARIYDRPLAEAEIAKLKPNADDGSKPWAHWTFDDAKSTDRTGRFPALRLAAGAKIAGGRLVLDGKKAYALGAKHDEDLAFRAGGPPPSLAVKPTLPGPDIEAARRLRNHLLADPHRPTYHFTIPEDYAMPFDPNGAVYWGGRHHLFYIYQERGVHCFGHVSSLDLLHWRQHPPAVFPTPDSPERGIFSGNCFLTKDGKAAMLYHGVDAGNCISLADDELLERWRKLPTNPIVPNSGPDKPYASWDPHGWFDGQRYYAIFGGQPSGSPKPATIFRSADMTKWEYVGPFLHHEMPGVQKDEDISCPDFFKMGDKWVLVCISHNKGCRYYVGDWKNEQFHPEVHERMSWNDNLYFAPETILDAKRRRILWTWIFDQRGEPTRGKSGWSGEMSLPRELTLGSDNRLRIKPLDELQNLRYGGKSQIDLALKAGETHVLKEVQGDALEVQLEFAAPAEGQVGALVRRSPNGEEETAVYYDADRKLLVVDAAKSSLTMGARNREEAPFAPAPGETVRLRVFVDRSIVEAFANDRQAALRRAYPSRTDSVGVAVFAKKTPTTLKQVHAWKMMPTNAY